MNFRRDRSRFGRFCRVGGDGWSGAGGTRGAGLRDVRDGILGFGLWVRFGDGLSRLSCGIICGSRRPRLVVCP